MAFCTNCGKQLKNGAGFCTNCGTPVKWGKSTQSNTGISSVVGNARNVILGFFADKLQSKQLKKTGNTEQFKRPEQPTQPGELKAQSFFLWDCLDGQYPVEQ